MQSSIETLHCPLTGEGGGHPLISCCARTHERGERIHLYVSELGPLSSAREFVGDGQRGVCGSPARVGMDWALWGLPAMDLPA